MKDREKGTPEKNKSIKKEGFSENGEKPSPYPHKRRRKFVKPR